MSCLDHIIKSTFLKELRFQIFMAMLNLVYISMKYSKLFVIALTRSTSEKCVGCFWPWLHLRRQYSAKVFD